MWQNVLVAKIPCGEISLWRIIVANNPVAKLSVANHPFTFSICPWSEPWENEMSIVVLEPKNIAAMKMGAPHLL